MLGSYRGFTDLYPKSQLVFPQAVEVVGKFLVKKDQSYAYNQSDGLPISYLSEV